MTTWMKWLRARISRRPAHSAEVERQIEVVDPARHLGEEFPSVDIQRRYGRT